MYSTGCGPVGYDRISLCLGLRIDEENEYIVLLPQYVVSENFRYSFPGPTTLHLNGLGRVGVVISFDSGRMVPSAIGIGVSCFCPVRLPLPDRSTYVPCAEMGSDRGSSACFDGMEGVSFRDSGSNMTKVIPWRTSSSPTYVLAPCVCSSNQTDSSTQFGRGIKNSDSISAENTAQVIVHLQTATLNFVSTEPTSSPSDDV